MKSLQMASGTVPGRTHQLTSSNNQDSSHWIVESDLIVLAVCDGCSDAEHSEVGARLGVRFLTSWIKQLVRQGKNPTHQPEFWEDVRQGLLFKIREWANDLGGKFSTTVRDHFLFTTLVGVITPSMAVFASIGDGVLIVNGEIVEVPTMYGNKPPYVAYALLSTTEEYPLETLQFKIQFQLPTSALNHFLIGTDGVRDLIAHESSFMPGTTQPVGHISQLWLQDVSFDNPDMIRRQLAKANNAKTVVVWEEGRLQKFKGLLPDDTTLIVGRMVDDGEG